MGPMSLRAEYERDVARELAHVPTVMPVTEADLEPLPAPVERYLRTTGVVGQPRVLNFRVRMHGRIRNGPDAAWMPLRAEQYNFVESRSRFFYLTSSMFLIPVSGYHRYAQSSAAMNIKAAGLVQVAHATGDELFQSETVTLLNDMCLFAPATLVDPALVWEPVNGRTARVRFTNAGRTVRAELTFNDGCELTNFSSEDRYQASPDGKSMTRRRWSTPVARYRSFGPVRLVASGEARWDMSTGSYSYIELEVDDVEYNLRAG